MRYKTKVIRLRLKTIDYLKKRFPKNRQQNISDWLDEIVLSQIK